MFWRARLPFYQVLTKPTQGQYFGNNSADCRQGNYIYDESIEQYLLNNRVQNIYSI